MAELLFKELSYQIVGAAMEVHNQLGSGFLESVYQKALAHELRLRGIAFEEQVHLPVTYKGELLGDYIADIVVDRKIVLELKAVSAITEAHKAQAIHYLAATGHELAIILNFGESKLKQERAVRHHSFESKEHS
jgi:GxxExxY protein